MRIILAFLLALAAAPLSAQDMGLGESLYRLHCASCHGDAAKGDGPLAGALLRDPPDLTQLAASNGGAFPTQYVVDMVDGTERMIAHGDPMPVFSILLDGPSVVIVGGDGADAMAPEPIANLVLWLESIQE